MISVDEGVWAFVDGAGDKAVVIGGVVVLGSATNVLPGVAEAIGFGVEVATCATVF
jgi:hypothetical protein